MNPHRSFANRRYLIWNFHVIQFDKSSLSIDHLLMSNIFFAFTPTVMCVGVKVLRYLKEELVLATDKWPWIGNIILLSNKAVLS